MLSAANNGDAALVRSIDAADASMEAYDPSVFPPIRIPALLGNQVALETLIETGADLEGLVSSNGRTTLLCSASVGESNALLVLIKAGAGLNAKNSHGDKFMSGHRSPLRQVQT